MGRGRGRGRQGGGGFEDQYGEGGHSQDRQEHSGFAGRGGASAGGGGGDAGDCYDFFPDYTIRCPKEEGCLCRTLSGGGRKGSNVNYVRQVPKFLQGHMHLLGARNDEDVQEQLSAKREMPQWDSDEDEAAEKEDALRRAVAQDANLAEQYPELASLVAKNEAEAEKEKGNKAFSGKRHDDAVRHFSKAIGLEPGNEIYYSNRAAAHTALKNYRGALSDGREVVRLKPRWAKGWARIGAAHMGLEEFQEAREAYEKALEIEPDDKGLQEARHRAHVAEHKAMEVHKHKFKRRHLDSDQRQNPNAAKKRPQAPVAGSAIAAAGMSNKSKLSFDEDDESEDA